MKIAWRERWGGPEVVELSLIVRGLTGPLLRDGKHLSLMPGWRPFHPDDVAALRQLVAEGAIAPRIDRRYPLTEVASALRAVDEGRAQGKVVIVVDPAPPG